MSQIPQNPRSLEEVHRSIKLPTRWWRRILAFFGPAYLVSVGYMDPGNWATDLEGGARFGYSLLWVLLLSNAMAVLFQTLSARLGIVTGRDLAQACRDEYPPFVRVPLFILCEIAITACDLAEVIGSAIGLNLLFGIPLLWAVLITGADVLIIMMLHGSGMRRLEAVILSLIAVIGICFVVEIVLCRPPIGEVASGCIPRSLSGPELYVAIGILGATIMPHNLYLHSALVQSRDVHRSREAVAQACRYNFFDSLIAMNGACLINAAILIVAASTFWSQGKVVTEIQQAHEMLDGALGTWLAPFAFALALLIAGQSSTVTGTLAGQITLEGFLQFRMTPWVRRVITRSLAIIPAVLVILWVGEKGVYQLLILSQVVLSLQLAFAIVPLVRFTGSRQKMGPFASPLWLRIAAWLAAIVIMGLNARLVYEEIGEWVEAAGAYGWLVGATMGAVVFSLGLLLAYLVLRRERPPRGEPTVTPEQVVAAAALAPKRFSRIGVALDALPSDSAMLAEAVALARTHSAALVLIHVVDGAGGQWYGPQTGDLESRSDEAYLQGLLERLRLELPPTDVPDIRTVLGYGNPIEQLVQISQREELDLIVMGGHGHRGIFDFLHGTTISGVRHDLTIPVFTVRR